MKSTKQIAELAAILVHAGYITEATKLLEGCAKESATEDLYVKKIKPAFDKFAKDLPKKLQQVSTGKIKWVVLNKEEHLSPTSTGGGALMGVYFQHDEKDSSAKGVATSPSGDPYITISQWEPEEDEFAVMVGLDFEEGGTKNFLEENQATAQDVLAILKGKATKIFQRWVQKNNFVLTDDDS